MRNKRKPISPKRESMEIAIIDYGSGNLRSAAAAFHDVAPALGCNVRVTANPEDIAGADGIVLPGVGAFADCMRGLTSIDGMRGALQQKVMQEKTPFLGICVGMQLLFTRGLEHGAHEGLGWLAGEVAPIEPIDKSLKIPHMGWNDLKLEKPSHPLLQDIKTGDHAYFVHSYHARLEKAENLLASVEYGGSLTAIVASGNVMGTQFHPEKSQATGMKLISNFLSLVRNGYRG